MARGGEGILEADLGRRRRVRARRPRRCRRSSPARARARARRPGARRARCAAGRGRRVKAGRGVRPPPPARPARRSRSRAARDPQQEQVEHGEKPELHRHGHRSKGAKGGGVMVGQRACLVAAATSGPRRRARPAPISITSPSVSRVGTPTGRPLSRTPLVEPRSMSVQPSRSGTICAWRRETSCAGDHDVGVGAAPDHDACRADRDPLAARPRARPAAAPRRRPARSAQTAAAAGRPGGARPRAQARC